MFKKSKIAAAVLAAASATSVQAVHMSNDGTGQVLIFPYYNVNNNFVTNINITNTTGAYKAVKVRFRESNDSNDVLDFNVYMSPYDQWTATVEASGDGARIRTTDETCTYPDKALLQAGADFVAIYDAIDLNDTREGYIEVIEMGEIADGAGPADDSGEIAEIEVDGGVLGTVTANDRSIIAGLLHDSDGMPADCTVVADAWAATTAEGGFTRGALAAGIASDAGPTDAYTSDTLNHGVVTPGGGLAGYSILINSSNGAAYVAQPAVIDDYSTDPQHYQSDDSNFYLLPSLASGDNVVARVPAADGSVSDVTWQTFLVDPGSLDDISPNSAKVSGQNPMPISHALAVTGFANDYFVQASVNGATDWVITFPMKKHGIWNGEAYVAATANACDTDDDGTGDATGLSCPYADIDNPAAVDDDVVDEASIDAEFDATDVVFSYTYYDREEQDYTPAPGNPGFSPVVESTPTVAILSREVNIISFSEAGGETESVLGTPDDNVFSISLQSGWDQGWVNLTFDSRYVLAEDAAAGDGVAAEPFQEISNDVGAVAGFTQNAEGAVFTGAGAGILGVPALGFSAMRADIGPAAVGETVDHIRMK